MKAYREELGGDQTDFGSHLDSLKILPEKAKIFPTLTRPLFYMAVSVFLVEIIIEQFILRVSIFGFMEHVLVDATGTILLLSPIFFFCLYKPFLQLDTEQQKAKTEIQALSRQLINIGELERKALARDLHDDLGQILTALQLGVETMAITCDLNLKSERNPEEIRLNCRKQGEKLTYLIEDLGQRIRKISAGLRPPMLDELGLEVTLEWLVNEYSKQSDKIDINLTCQGISDGLFPEVELGIFRICQEGLNNTFKHSDASHVEIHLNNQDDRVMVLSIKDNGIGFSSKELHSAQIGRRGSGRQGVGLLGIRERVAALNGYLELRTGKKQGTEIYVKIPTKRPERKEYP